MKTLPIKTLIDHLNDFLVHYKALNYGRTTLNAYRINIGRFIKWLKTAFGITAPEQIRPDHLSAWMRALGEHRTQKGLPLRPSSMNKNIENTRKFVTFLIRRGCLHSSLADILEYVKEPEMLPTSVLTHAQVRKLLARIQTGTGAGYRDRAMFETLYTTGIRANELLGMDVSHVDIRNASALITAKGRHQRIVPVGKTALACLKTYITAVRPFFVQNPAEPALFLNGEGRRIIYHMFRKSLKTYADAAGLENVTLHTFRRSFATELLRGGANMYHVKELMGHKTLNTLRHYAKLTITDLKKTHRKCHPRERDAG